MPRHKTSGTARDDGGLALGAWNAFDRPLALIGRGGDLLLTNSAFDTLVPGCREDSLGSIWREVGRKGSGEQQLTLADGRVLDVEVKETADGLMLLADGQPRRTQPSDPVDPVTGLGSRAWFVTTMAEGLRHQAGEISAVLLIELDRYPTIKQTLGEAVANSLLRAAADRLRSTLGANDLSARTGDHEFAVLQSGRDQPAAATALTTRIIDLLGRSYILDGQILNIGANAGIALSPANGQEPDQLTRSAGLALNHAKAGGRNTYRLFEQSFDTAMMDRRNLEIDLRRALALRELRLVYQPQLDIASRKITGFEALLRWHHPVRGVVSPADFIPIAEETGLIMSMGEWVIRTACREAAGWTVPLKIAVNVSAVQFAGPGLVATIVSALAESGIDPTRLEVEITESLLLGDHQAVLKTLMQLKQLGVRISMDDFGTGYSSLSYLRSFPFDKIKIDQSFVRGKSDEASGMAIVRAIASLGKSLDMSTIAEGVETAAQFQKIMENGCTAVQGYLISRPMPPELIPAFLAKTAETSAESVIAGIMPHGQESQ